MVITTKAVSLGQADTQPQSGKVGLGMIPREEGVGRAPRVKPVVEGPEFDYPSLVPQVFRVLVQVTGYLSWSEPSETHGRGRGSAD